MGFAVQMARLHWGCGGYVTSCPCWCKHGDIIFSFWSPSMSCFSNLLVHMKADEAQSSRTPNFALITVMGCLSGCHKLQCCLVFWWTPSRGGTDSPVSCQSPVLGSDSIWVDIYCLKTNIMTLSSLMQRRRSLSERICSSKTRGFWTKSWCWVRSWHGMGDVVTIHSDSAVITFARV